MGLQPSALLAVKLYCPVTWNDAENAKRQIRNLILIF